MNRLLGLETEYAIRFTPDGGPRPTNARVFEAYTTAVKGLVATRRGMRTREVFLANGGALHYEARVTAEDDGLVEGATPECRGPSTALLYQRAQDALLNEATPLAAAELRADGYPGDLGLLKNCRDADGHWYGAQENYEVEIARGPWLVLWRAGLIALLPVILVATLWTWALVAVLFPVALAGALVVVIIALSIGEQRSADLRVRLGRPFLRVFAVGAVWLELALWQPCIMLFLLLYRAVAFRRIRRTMIGFLVTRQVFTGAGTLEHDRLVLSEKAIAAGRLCRVSTASPLAIFDAGNFCKHLTSLIHFRPRGYLSLFRKKQRLQLGLSDSNMAQVAEYLKIATTTLLLDLAEAGALDDLPPPRHPIRTLHRIARDPDLRHAIALQREYLARAHRFVRSHPTPPLEALDVVERWRETLDALERDPDELFGCVDWVTKRHLIRTAAAQPAERKKIDLKYHELGAGYFARIEQNGFAPMLVSDAEAYAARTQPPPDSPARARARVIRELIGEAAKIRMTWDHVRIGNRFTGRVIRLDDHR